MSRFVSITQKVLSANKEFADYLLLADIKPARGKEKDAFVGNYKIAPKEFCQYGIVLSRGGMIIPDIKSEDLVAIVQREQEERAAEDLRRQKEAETVYQAAEQKIAGARSQLLSKVQAASKLLKDNAGPHWRLQALEYGKQEPCVLYRADLIKRFEAAHKIGLLGLPPVTDETIVFEWVAEDITRLTRIVEQWFEKTEPRRKLLWKLFVKNKGIFTKTEKERSCYAGKSFSNAKVTAHTSHYSEARFDEWIEVIYYIGDEKVSSLEHKWLKALSEELEVPEGYIRVANDTNDLMSILEMPGQKDVLVVEGKTGSRRGVWSYGEWFRGHPSKCDISFYSKGTAKKIKSVTLNGEVQESNRVNLRLWTDPQELAKWALKEAGMEKPASEYIKALAEVYRRQLNK